MKRLSLIISIMLLALAANAQTYNVHMKNGEVLQLNSSDVDYIDFSASSSGSSTPEGVEAVDLGLPSGTLWANMNVGAEKPEDYGDYFAWGVTTPQSDNAYSWDSYKWCNGSSKTLTKYCTKASYGYNGYTDTKTVLDAEDDAATANWGGDWRMPTMADFEELLTNTTSEWTTQNGVNGRKFTSKTNGNSIFLPAAGYRWNGVLYNAGSYGNYWSSSLLESYLGSAWSLFFGSGYVYTNNDYRYGGRSVRPVKSDTAPDYPDLQLSETQISIVKGSSTTVEITSGSGEYGVTNLNSSIAKATLQGTTITISALSEGNAKVVATDMQTGQKIIIEITVTISGDIVAYTSCPDSHHPHLIDLGLPSGTKWRCCNEGASTPEAYGGYYTFGQVSSAPTLEQIRELLGYCSYKWTTQNGVNGGKFTGPNGGTIFLPAAGNRMDGEFYGVGSHGLYWSSTPRDVYYYAYVLGFYSDDAYWYDDSRVTGYPFRPVCKN